MQRYVKLLFKLVLRVPGKGARDHLDGMNIELRNKSQYTAITCAVENDLIITVIKLLTIQIIDHDLDTGKPAADRSAAVDGFNFEVGI